MRSIGKGALSGLYSRVMKAPARNNADTLRIDRWLWCARFFKSRAQASAAVAGGHVRVDGERVKPARALRVGARLEIAIGSRTVEVLVSGLPDRRGPASEAGALYAETEESRARASTQRAARASGLFHAPAPAGRPNKRERRALLELSRPGRRG
jgi:ribosome-associated heat shock protein Hsp15